MKSRTKKILASALVMALSGAACAQAGGGGGAPAGGAGGGGAGGGTAAGAAGEPAGVRVPARAVGAQECPAVRRAAMQALLAV
jgi:hypothetical protein